VQKHYTYIHLYKYYIRGLIEFCSLYNSVRFQNNDLV